VHVKNVARQKVQFLRFAGYFATKFCTIINQGLKCTVYIIPVIYIEMAGSEMQSTIFISGQPAVQNRGLGGKVGNACEEFEDNEAGVYCINMNSEFWC